MTSRSMSRHEALMVMTPFTRPGDDADETIPPIYFDAATDNLILRAHSLYRVKTKNARYHPREARMRLELFDQFKKRFGIDLCFGLKLAFTNDMVGRDDWIVRAKRYLRERRPPGLTDSRSLAQRAVTEMALEDHHWLEDISFTLCFGQLDTDETPTSGVRSRSRIGMGIRWWLYN